MRGHDKGGGVVRFESAVRGLTAASVVALSVGASTVPARADDDDGGSPGWSDKLSDSMKNTISRATSAVGLNKPQGPPPKEAPSGCPTIAVLDGTQSQRVNAAGATGNQGLRYQFSLYNIGRECSISGGRIVVKVGADGRVLLGPAGSPSHFDVPIRVVIIDDANGKPVASKLFKVPVNMGGGQVSVPYQFVSDDIVVPIAAGRTGTDYSIKVGLDGKGGGDALKVAGKGRHRHQKAMESASQ